MDKTDESACASDACGDPTSQGGTKYSKGNVEPQMVRRFKRDESGNQRSSPHGSKTRKKIVRDFAHETHKVTENGRSQWRSTLELMLLALRNLAAEGNPRAIRAYQKYLARYEPQPLNSNLGVLVVGEDYTEEEAEAVAEVANARAAARRRAEAMKDLPPPTD